MDIPWLRARAGIEGTRNEDANLAHSALGGHEIQEQDGDGKKKDEPGKPHKIREGESCVERDDYWGISGRAALNWLV